MTDDVKVEVSIVPDTYDLSDWRAVVAVKRNGAYWPIGVAFPGRGEIIRKALQTWIDTDPAGLVDAIYESMGNQP